MPSINSPNDPGQPERRLDLRLPVDCPRCHGKHIASVAALVVPQPLFFGGPADAPPRWTLRLSCPVVGRAFDADIALPVDAGVQVRRVDVMSVDPVPDPALLVGDGNQPPTTAADPSAATWLIEEFDEWRKSSGLTLRGFAASMLATSTGAVAVYFAILKYAGLERISGGWRVLTIGPAVLFLASAATWVLALRPGLAWAYDVAEFADYRRRRLVATRRLTDVGLGLFLAAVAFAIAMLAAVML